MHKETPAYPLPNSPHCAIFPNHRPKPNILIHILLNVKLNSSSNPYSNRIYWYFFIIMCFIGDKFGE